MPLLKIKLVEADGAAALKTAVDAYLTAQSVVASVRGAAVCSFKSSDGDHRLFQALAINGRAVPAAGTRTSDVQFLSVEAETLALAQTALDNALFQAVHATNAAGNANTTPGSIITGASLFVAGDVGRQITIGSAVRTITSFTSATTVVYSGALIAGTGLLVKLHGAEVLQPGTLDLNVTKSAAGVAKYAVSCTVNGEAQV